MWSLQWVIQCWEHYLHGGDKNDLEENYGYVAEMLLHCRLLTNERGLIEIPGAWNLIDWSNNDLSIYGEVTGCNVFLVHCFQSAVKMARALGYEEQAVKYELEVKNRIAIINKYCWDNERHAYVDTVRDEWTYNRYVEFCELKGKAYDLFEQYMSLSRISEQTNTLAIICNCVPEDRICYVTEIANRVKNGLYVYGAPSSRTYGQPSEKEAPGGIVAIGTPFFLFFSLERLFMKGDKEAALEIIKRDWGKMASKGINTCWETFCANETYWTRSVCHAWSASPAVYLPSQVLGIRPVEAGYKKFVIEPYVETLEWAKGSVATPHGPIYVNWQRNEKGIVNIEWSAPKGCECISEI